MSGVLGRLRDPRWLVFAVVAAVAVFAFIVSYSHIYDLGRAHAQSGVAARLLPLSVDLLIIGASLVLFIQGRESAESTGLARWLPRSVLWASIGATVAANVAYGLPHGWLAAVISGWPGAAFVAAVEVAMVTVRPAVANDPEISGLTATPAGQGSVPATAYDAAVAAWAASVAGGNPLTEYQLHKRFGIARSVARKIVSPPDRDRGAVIPPLPHGAPVTSVTAPPAGGAAAAMNGDGRRG